MLHECRGKSKSTCGFLGGTCNLFPTYSTPPPPPPPPPRATTTTTTTTTTTSSEGSESEGAVASYVDCTLSLGTPSTRHAGVGPGLGGPDLRWDVLAQPNKQHYYCGGGGGGGGGGGVLARGNNGGDAPTSTSPRRCANCDTTSTPLWRNGPRGPKSLCNACGIRYKKEERRAATAPPAAAAAAVQQQQQQWGCYGAAAKGAVSIATYADDGRADSWRLNAVPAAAAAAAQAPQFHVLDRPSLFQYN